jgi:hypothetical protein
VVTHPAYFDPGQVQETREAAVDAGYDMSHPGQMMMEPAAAALSYTLNDERDPLTVMTYDLGGGTFDVTVLEKREGLITMRAFDGGHLLGGYNLDRAFVRWLLEDLAAKGRVIPYDETNEEDRGRRARLLHVAENVKMRLAEQKNAKTQVPVKVDFLVDAEGRPVQFMGRINREQYTELVREEMAVTVACCRRALAQREKIKERGNCKTARNGKFHGGRVVPPEGQVHSTHRNHFKNVGYTRALRPGTTQPTPIMQLPRTDPPYSRGRGGAVRISAGNRSAQWFLTRRSWAATGGRTRRTGGPVRCGSIQSPGASIFSLEADWSPRD